MTSKFARVNGKDCITPVYLDYHFLFFPSPVRIVDCLNLWLASVGTVSFHEITTLWSTLTRALGPVA